MIMAFKNRKQLAGFPISKIVPVHGSIYVAAANPYFAAA
jgi:hypothetical protein